MKKIIHQGHNSFISTLLGVVFTLTTFSIFYFLNSLSFPFPNSMNFFNLEHVMTYYGTLPHGSYFLVLFGWMFSGFIGGYVTAFFSKEKFYNLTFLVGTFAFFCTMFDGYIHQHSFTNMLLAAIFVIAFNYLGYLFYRNN